MKSNPLVSILMNCYNGEKYLKESLQSILSQTYQNWELIFWDNCSTDSSREIFQEFKNEKMHYYCSPRHTNLGEARRLASKNLKGELVAILDIDDIWLPQKLEKQIMCFRDADVGISITNTKIFSDSGCRKMYLARHKSGYVFSDMLKNYDISLETVMLRGSLLRELEFSGEYRHIADYDLIMRILERSKLSYVDEVLAKWRVHSLSCSALSPLINNVEKKMWISKNFKEEKLNKYRNEIEIAINRIEISELLREIKEHDKVGYKDTFKRLNFKFLISYIFICMISIPFGKNLINKLNSMRLGL